jgi:two-component system, chemotaxis family, chemotaxis protein CheY
MLNAMGHNVVASAKSGDEAVSKYSIYKPDIITMDITMPDMNGIDAAKLILDINPNALIIMVTSQGQEQMVIDSITIGAKGYVLKPIHPERLNDTIKQIYEKYGNTIN